MALFPQHANGSGDNLLWMKFNELVTLLNRWSTVVNADTVDGTHLSGLSVSGFVENADLDALDVTGLYNVLTVPATLIHIRWDVNYAMQIKQKYNTVDFAMRQKAGNVWGLWKTIWTSDNDGSASGLDADTIDGVHYSEGAFNPAPSLKGSGTAGTWGYSTAEGTYTKIGKLTHVDITIVPNSITGSPTGDLRLAGLPFTAASVNQMLPVITSGVDFSAGYTGLYALVVQGSTEAVIYQYGDNVAYLSLPVGAILANDTIRICGSYKST